MLADDFITALHADNEGNLWIAHLSYGVDVYNKNGVSVGIRTTKMNSKHLPSQIHRRGNLFYNGLRKKVQMFASTQQMADYWKWYSIYNQELRLI